METSICSTVEWTNENSKIKDIKVQKCFKETPLNIKSYKDYQSALYIFYNDLCMYEVEKSVDAFLNIHPNFVEYKDNLHIFMQHTAISIQIMLGSPLAKMPGNTSSRYPGYIIKGLQGISHENTSIINQPWKPDAPAFIEFISSNLLNVQSVTQTQKSEKTKNILIEKNGILYKQNKIWIIACLAYLQFLEDKNINTNLTTYDHSHLMYIFASLAWKVFSIMTNRFEDHEFKSDIRMILNSEDQNIVKEIRKKIVMIQIAEFALKQQDNIMNINTVEGVLSKDEVKQFYDIMKEYLSDPTPIKKVVTMMNGGYKKTGERAFIKGRNRVVYTRLRGGKARYIKSKHGFENIKT